MIAMEQGTKEQRVADDGFVLAMRALGRRIREQRTALGLSQWELAERMGVDPTTVSDFEQGRKSWPYTPAVVEKLAEVLGLTQGELVRGVMPSRSSPR